MCKKQPQLLVVLPGGSGRRRVLERICLVADVVVMVPWDAVSKCSWALDIVSADRWIALDAKESASASYAADRILLWLDGGGGLARGVHGVMTYDEFALNFTAELILELNQREHPKMVRQLPGNPVTSLACIRDKVAFRDCCKRAGVPVVEHIAVTLENVEEVMATWRHFPAVLKPARGAGSWNVMKIESAEDLLNHVQECFDALQVSAFPDEVKRAGFVIERFFAGTEVDVDGWVRHGQVEFQLVSDNKPPKEPYFLEMGGFYPSRLPKEAVHRLEALTGHVVAAFPGLHGVFHFEARINEETLEVMPIEYNARVGGAECPACVEAVTGHFLPEVAAYLALNMQVPPVGAIAYRSAASVNFFDPRGGCIAECSAENVDVVQHNVVCSVLFEVTGQAYNPNNGSASCLGWMASGGVSAEDAQQHLDDAVQEVRIRVE